MKELLSLIGPAMSFSRMNPSTINVNLLSFVALLLYAGTEAPTILDILRVIFDIFGFSEFLMRFSVSFQISQIHVFVEG